LDPNLAGLVSDGRGDGGVTDLSGASFIQNN
jgi:hypothetical protein